MTEQATTTPTAKDWREVVEPVTKSMKLPVIELRVAPQDEVKKKPMNCGVTVCYASGPPNFTQFSDFFEALKFAREVCGWAETGTPNRVIFEVFE